MVQNLNQLVHSVTYTLQQKDRAAFFENIKDLQKYDLTHIFIKLSSREQEIFLEFIPVSLLADVLSELDGENRIKVIKILDPEKVSLAVTEMNNDDLVSMLGQLGEEKSAELLTYLDEELSADIKNLLDFPPETAGRIMNNRMVWINQSYTVREAVDKLKQFAELAEYLNYLHVIDDDKRLVGVVSYRELLLADLHWKIADIMQTRIVKVGALMDQEEVARIIRRYDFVTIPVVDDKERLLGIVTVDDILDVVYQEAEEDIEKFSASGKAIDFKTKPVIAAKRRLSWLILLLFIGIVSGSIIASFEETLEQVVALAFFMPMVAGMTGNTGTQSLAVVIRGLAKEKIDTKQVLSLLMRELKVGIYIGLTCGLLIFVIAYLWQGSAVLGIVIGVSLLCTLIIGTLAGTIIPLILNRLNVDPAVASGPLITTINDILSLLIYFGIATAFLSYLM
ncbi:magnesium transporter MgtE [Jeotgalicoccus coquinae]|uniref:Magnesium transporter MgtE n=1 Tax=Jeotgalicoccus coquinae TaxID=709509 RepID=A0A6V7R2E9_9STAP|nr:magnesium transporter [Jeotgalicoccus coquinae]MBB6423539.1 magnesium transporter [Jeotgalicoccus coquinae]GGE20644.1 magnesium transporter MgtE [Jeotgalicoccus coquinae]CAD2071497.1 Magnesium transporter MgtE [Jeotgalicoccus coquinae]